MPLFECPHCNKLQMIPLALCEWMLDQVPFQGFDAGHNPVYTLACPECGPREPDDCSDELPN